MNLEKLEKHELIQHIRTLEKKVKETENANKNNKTWLALLAHDFKGVFGSIIWIDNLYKSGAVSCEILAELLPELKENASKNLRALEDTFLAARFHYDNILADPERINLTEIYQEIKDEFAEEIEKKQLQITFVGEEEIYIQNNKLMVKSVLTKIMDNAIKFSYKENRIEVTIEAVDDEHRIIVQDFGTGIDDYTFNKLFSLDVSPIMGTADEKGAGLGLILAKEALTLLNGSIHVHSIKDEGTQVHITL